LNHTGVPRPGIEEKLLDLVAAEIHQDAARLFLPEEPFRPLGEADPVRAHSDHLDHPADRSVGNQLLCKDGGLDMEPFAVIDGILPVRLRDLFPGRRDLVQRGEGGLVGKIVLPVVHRPKAEAAAVGGNGRTGDEVNRGILQDRLFRRNGTYIGECFPEIGHLGRIRIVHPRKLGTRLDQSVAHPENMAVIQPDHAYPEIPFPAHRGGFPLGSVIHSV